MNREVQDSPRAQFLKELAHLLQRLPEDERQDILFDYEGHVEAAVSEGRSEEEAVASLGSPRQIARELMADYYVERAKSTRSSGNIIRAIFASIGLGFFNLVIILGPTVAVLVVLLSLLATAVCLAVVPVIVFLAMLFQHATYHGVTPGEALLTLVTVEGVGLLLLAGTLALGKLLRMAVVRYLAFNLRIIRGGK